ncbi:hypothetical protein [Streptomyces nigrescens]|uniref:hypothetical protein n=1 Tax=Streptomyces nigrescens TaxID=1920 RepID=UPI003824E36B
MKDNYWMDIEPSSMSIPAGAEQLIRNIVADALSELADDFDREYSEAIPDSDVAEVYSCLRRRLMRKANEVRGTE